MEEILKQTSFVAKGVVAAINPSKSEKKPGAYVDLIIAGQRNFVNVFLRPESAAKAKLGQLLMVPVVVGTFEGRTFFTEA